MLVSVKFGGDILVFIDINGASASVRRQGILTCGMVGAFCSFRFSDEWESLSKTAVFRQGDTVRDAVCLNNVAVIPWEVLKVPGIPLEIGVYGTNTDGSTVIPTVWAKTRPLNLGADPSGDESIDPTPGVWEQIAARVNTAENGLTSKPEEIVFYYDEGVDYNEKNIESFLRLYELHSEGAPYTIKMIEEDYTVLPCELNLYSSKKWILKAYAVDYNCIYYITAKFDDGNVSSIEYEMGGLTASDVDADQKGTAAAKVGIHNDSPDAHSDIRVLLTTLENLVNEVEKRLEGIADSDDETLDQLSEIVAYIKSNKGLIDAVTTAKVSYSDIIDDLITDDASKPLSAAQGLVLKALIDTVQNSTAKVYTVPYYASPSDEEKAEVIETISKIASDGSKYAVLIKDDRNTLIPAECTVVATSSTATVTIRGIRHSIDTTPVLYTIIATIRAAGTHSLNFYNDLYMVDEIAEDMPLENWYKSPSCNAVYNFVANYVNQQIVEGEW